MHRSESVCLLFSATSDFSKTLGWAGEAHKDGKLIHILADENSVKNLATVDGKPVGNAMFLFQLSRAP